MPERARIGVTRWTDMSLDRVELYWDRLRQAGAAVIDLAGQHNDPQDLDGLVLTGGIDVEPNLYGETPHATVKRADPERDLFELDVLGRALERDVPVLAICRGHQVLNVALGGKLVQHIEGDGHLAHLNTESRPSRWHGVRLGQDSRLAEILGSPELEVNSRHHQAVTADTLATGLEAVAWSTDGLVEAIESRDHRWVLGVQWHPERLEPEHAAFAPLSRRLFSAFVSAASRVAPRA